MHTSGPKRNFNWRLETPERAHEAGFRRLGIGALYGLSDWRRETICLVAHAQYLLRHCWKSQLTVSLPRLRPCAGEFEPLTNFDDRALVQAICALRLFLPDLGIVLSTREPAALRDRLIPLGITSMSAGSHTEPGGYTGAGNENLHYTERGNIRELAGMPANGHRRPIAAPTPPASLTSPTSARRKRSPRRSAAWATNRSGKIGTPPFSPTDGGKPINQTGR